MMAAKIKITQRNYYIILQLLSSICCCHHFSSHLSTHMPCHAITSQFNVLYDFIFFKSEVITFFKIYIFSLKNYSSKLLGQVSSFLFWHDKDHTKPHDFLWLLSWIFWLCTYCNNNSHLSSTTYSNIPLIKVNSALPHFL